MREGDAWGDADPEASIDRRLPFGQFVDLVRERQDGELPPCPACGEVPTVIDLEGNPGQHVLRFQPCGHTIGSRSLP